MQLKIVFMGKAIALTPTSSPKEERAYSFKALATTGRASG